MYRLHRSGWLVVQRSQIRTVTDIQYYREVDQSHLHLVPAQSTFRQFLIKLKEKEMKEKKLLELKMAQEAGIEIPTGEIPRQTKITLPKYIERKPSDILRAISSQIGRDYTAPDYRFHDDPYLAPYNSIMQRDYILSKEGGKKTARYILDNHPELFLENLIEAEPPIKAFMPKVVFNEDIASKELLEGYLEGFNVLDAMEVYKALKKKGEAVDPELEQKLLETICFFSETEAPDENCNQVSKLSYEEKIKWKSGGLAEKIYSKMNPITDEARIAMLLGLARHGEFSRGWNMFEECKKNNVKMTTDAFNAAIRCMEVKKGFKGSWPNILGLLNEMKAQNCPPNERTLLAIMQFFRRFRTQESCHLALRSLAEFRKVGFDIPLAAYAVLCDIFTNGLDSASCNEALHKFFGEIESKKFTRVQNENDFYFFVTFMNAACDSNDMHLAYRINDYLEIHGHDILLSNNHHKLDYYKKFLSLVLKNEAIDDAMKFIDKYTPYVFPPTFQFMQSLLEEIGIQEGFKYLPKLWVDCQVSRFMFIVRHQQMKMIYQFLELCISCNTKEAEFSYLDPSFDLMAKEAFEEVKKEPLHKALPLHENLDAARICNQVIQLSLRSGNFNLADDVIQFCYDESTKIPDNLSDVVLEDYLENAVKRGEKKKALLCTMYAIELSLPNASELTLKYATSFSLSSEEKGHLNSFFVHDSRWEVLN